MDRREWSTKDWRRINRRKRIAKWQNDFLFNFIKTILFIMFFLLIGYLSNKYGTK